MRPHPKTNKEAKPQTDKKPALSCHSETTSGKECILEGLPDCLVFEDLGLVPGVMINQQQQYDFLLMNFTSLNLKEHMVGPPEQ